MAGASAPLLRVRGLVKHYPSAPGGRGRRHPVKAVDGVDLDLLAGQTLGLVGESGCGKSTLAKVLMALERPTAGTVEFEGREIFGLGRTGVKALRRDVQMVMQDPYTSLDPRQTVGDTIGEPYDIHRDIAPKSGRTARVGELMELVGLDPDHAGRYPHQFSGGQRQRVGIARALALGPKLLICDEPVSALDVSIQAQVVNLLERLRAEMGLSYVFIAHDLAVVRHVADRVAVMYLGRVVEIGERSEVFDSPAHPYTKALMSAVPLPDPTVRGTRARIVLEGDLPSPIDPPSGCRFRTRCWMAEERCAAEDPELVVRPDVDHPSACHFAAVGA